MEKTGKKYKHYKLLLADLPTPNDEQAPARTLEFEFENHDDVFEVIEKIKRKNLFSNEADAAEFALGLKLFTEVILRNRQLDVFSDLQPAIRDFMKKLKAI
jgi:hypothetical protein